MLLLGALPCAILNAVLLTPMLKLEYMNEDFSSYLWTMILLVFIQAPWATAFMTLLLGDIMFMQETSSRQIIKTVLAASGKMAWCHGVMRGVFPAIYLAYVAGTPNGSWAIGLLSVMAFILVFYRGQRPFLNEIVLLEKNPLRSSNSLVQTIHRRSSRLHGPSSSYVMGRSLATVFIAVLLAYLLVLLFWFVPGTLLNQWAWGPAIVYVVLPTSMWIVAGYVAVIRFLTYLDLRIRREGWAVELHIRAEASNLARHMS